MREAFLAFLKEAKPHYESPGEIDVRLLEDRNDDHRFIELILYDNEAAYVRDQVRVRDDPQMRSYIARWRALLVEDPVIEVFRLATL